MKAKQLLSKLEKSYNTYLCNISNIESELQRYCQFDDFTIFYQQSDGFVLEYKANNAPLFLCIDIIKKKGILSEDDYFDLCI